MLYYGIHADFATGRAIWDINLRQGWVAADIFLGEFRVVTLLLVKSLHQKKTAMQMQPPIREHL